MVWAMLTSVLHLLGFGPTTRPKARWTPLLTVIMSLGVLALFADGLTTLVALSSTGHPLAMETNPLVAAAIGIGGLPAVLILKLLQIVVIIGVVDYARRRGLPRTALAIAIAAIIFGLFATCANLFVLTLPTYSLSDLY